jgi:hypothetical protein
MMMMMMICFPSSLGAVSTCVMTVRYDLRIGACVSMSMRSLALT